MKRILSVSIAAMSIFLVANSQTPVISSYDINRQDDSILLSMTIASDKAMKTDREVLVTPVLRSLNTPDSLSLRPVIIAGRSRYFANLRHGIVNPSVLYKATKDLNISYADTVAFLPWMTFSHIDLIFEERGCCGEQKSTDSPVVPMADLDFRPYQFEAELAYIKPIVKPEDKVRTINGSAYIDFPVNITEIRPAYRRNPIELAKINATIDSVRLDEDIKIDAVSIKGFASPEGSYSNNVRLARGRTAALKEYVQMLHNFTPGIISTSYEPEDWEGLRRYVDGSSMEHRDDLLAIIDGNLEPDAKDAMLKKTFPKEYAFLLMNVYPALRHSDYTIDYTIRSFTDPQEILRLVKTAPQKLSLNEFYVAAATLPQDSPEYESLWETAVRMYPTSEVAIVNAANAAISVGHLDRAEQLLELVGENPDAIYTRGNLAALKGRLDDARNFFSQAAKLKVADAPAALERLNKISNTNPITRLLK